MEKKKGFERFELHERIYPQLTKLGFERPTDVQDKVIPQFLQRFNLIVEAPTGTGKTAAYGFPLITRLDLLKRSTQALILTPSRELALQVSAALQSYFDGTQLKIAAVYGGATLKESIDAIKSHPHILVAVPGRLRDVMSQVQYDYLWRDVRYLIVDEADKMLETGFQKDFDHIRENIRSTAQIGFFSATISRDSEEMIRERIRPVKTVRLSPRQMLRNIYFAYIKPELGQTERYLLGLIEQRGIEQALIFCGKREEIHSITGFLRNLGYRAEAYYGTQTQEERQNILKRFKERHIELLVASDLAARGLDIQYLPAVINLSIPEEFDFYLHRIGRTGRAGNKGAVFNIIANELEQVFMKNHHRKIGIPIRTIEINPIDKDRLMPDREEKWTKYHLSRGKRDKIRKGDIVGFLVNQAELNADEIGTITIYDAYSVVDMPQRGFKTLSHKEEDLLLKGKSVKVRKYQLEEQERRAKAVKRLLKDRKKL